jgi:excisionase family DNA binding protein
MEITPNAELLTPEQLAEKLNVSLKFVRKHIADRRIPGMRRVGRLIRFSPHEIEKALLKENFLLPVKNNTHGTRW